MIASPFALFVALAWSVSAPLSTWEVRLVTTGGFTGGGAGGILVRSDGAAELLQRNPARGDPPHTSVCQVRLTTAELADLEEAMRTARPADWHDRYVVPENPNGCCDMLGWQLSVERAESGKVERSATFWYDDAAPRLPRDLQSLRTRLNALWTLVRGKCQK
jgi:hypothetical protein